MRRVGLSISGHTRAFSRLISVSAVRVGLCFGSDGTIYFNHVNSICLPWFRQVKIRPTQVWIYRPRPYIYVYICIYIYIYIYKYFTDIPTNADDVRLTLGITQFSSNKAGQQFFWNKKLLLIWWQTKKMLTKTLFPLMSHIIVGRQKEYIWNLE